MLHYIDLIGTFVFAISGALAAIQRRLDILGVFVAAFVTGCGGGVIRDVCLGAFPPAGLISMEYLILVTVAVILTAFSRKLLRILTEPALFFDAVGLGFFAAFGVHKSYSLYGNTELALFLGCISAVGGGALRDIFLRRVPVIFTKEIYATAALAGAAIQLAGEVGYINKNYSLWFAIGTCTLIRLLAIRFKLNLPRIHP